jgi:hypothetical protein
MTTKTTEFNAETGETIEREATAEEIAALENMRAKLAAIEADEAAKASAKEALLKRLGITAEEAKLLLA